ncbi:MAG: saccharopine dehydrogenase NADP-binding domain-containing protein [Chitinophagaceae bacterium]|jgi:short subunit dehydrogenase-like uncharacterized protein|nr:saccharopine dehydrogenase NADP-binding domain-containing protein [Chitinophagaceae bacterium]
MASSTFLLYGANGYTGRLITDLAVAYGLRPVLAGRNEKSIRQMADKYSLDHRIFDLSENSKLIDALNEVPLVLNAAGPFRYTAEQVTEACLHTKTHYIDITGEIEVFEMIKLKGPAAKQAGILLLPGAGFDVVPTDCMALWLKQQLPMATKLQLAFASAGSGVSHGTAHTMIEGLGMGGAVRKNGKIISKPLGHKGMWVDFGPKKLFVMSIPWGDVSTAYDTTGIPDIVAFTSVPINIYRSLKFQSLFNWILKTKLIKDLARNKINSGPAGPSAEKRKSSVSYIWGKAEDANGNIVTGRMVTPDGYTLTAHSSLIITKKILNNNLGIGYHTPAGLYGADLVLEVPGTQRID